MKAKVNILLFIGFLTITLGLSFHFYGYEKTWRLWNIPTMSPHFADLYTITSSAESHKQGYDPMVNNPSDPWQRTMNYPRIWQIISFVGVNQSHTMYIGIGFIFLFLSGVYLLLVHSNNITMLYIMAAVLSPATLLGAERGNTDLLMFFLLAVAIILVDKHHFLSTISVLFGFVLKLFPVFGIVVLLRKKKKVFLSSIVTSIIIGLSYILFTLEDIMLIREATPRSTSISYGLNVLWMKIMMSSSRLGFYFKILSYLLILLAVFYAFVTLTHKDFPQLDKGESVSLDAFRVGGFVYIGTFFLGNNWDYRLMFLIFTIPQLLAWINCSHLYISTISKITLLCIYVSLWDLIINQVISHFPYGSYVSFLLNELSNWVIFFGILHLFFLSMPSWIKQLARNLQSKTKVVISTLQNKIIGLPR